MKELKFVVRRGVACEICKFFNYNNKKKYKPPHFVVNDGIGKKIVLRNE